MIGPEREPGALRGSGLPDGFLMLLLSDKNLKAKVPAFVEYFKPAEEE
jgi:hypothetical protein